MNREQAEQIANLLNEQNRLDGEYTAGRVLASAGEYLFQTDGETGRVTAFVQLKRVQWYQHEMLHLSVSPEHRREGLARRLSDRAEELARREGACIIQCTIRSDNRASMALAESCGLRRTATFHNHSTGNDVTVWQKVLAPPRGDPGA